LTDGRDRYALRISSRIIDGTRRISSGADAEGTAFGGIADRVLFGL